MKSLVAGVLSALVLSASITTIPVGGAHADEKKAPIPTTGQPTDKQKMRVNKPAFEKDCPQPDDGTWGCYYPEKGIPKGTKAK
ncbi:MAG: hypothetical protein AB7E55_28495 [Pigmentiphaga sp.]